MVEKITKKVLKEVIETVSEVIICDVCGKKLNYEKQINDDKVSSYYHIVTGHHDWGNDSCESIRYIDACCDECLSKASSDWIKDEEVKRSFTAYFEVTKKRHWLKENNND